MTKLAEKAVIGAGVVGALILLFRGIRLLVTGVVLLKEKHGPRGRCDRSG